MLQLDRRTLLAASRAADAGDLDRFPVPLEMQPAGEGVVDQRLRGARVDQERERAPWMTTRASASVSPSFALRITIGIVAWAACPPTDGAPFLPWLNRA